MKKLIVIFLTVIVLLSAALFVFSDQNGTDKWCNIDEYGCWVTEEDGGKSYIYFWSEDARSYVMGDGSEPGSHVVDTYRGNANYGTGKLPLMDPIPNTVKLTTSGATNATPTNTNTTTTTTGVPTSLPSI